MKPEWKDFLTDAGAEFAADGRVESFGNPNRELQVSPAGEVICDLSHLGLISAHGEVKVIDLGLARAIDSTRLALRAAPLLQTHGG